MASVSSRVGGEFSPAGTAPDRDPVAPSLCAITVPLDPARLPGGLVGLVETTRRVGLPAVWLRRGNGLVGIGTAARYTASGPERFARARQWWRQIAASARRENHVGGPGTGPLAFGSFAFADDSGFDSRLIVPALVVGAAEDGRCWLTQQVVGDDAPTAASAHAAFAALASGSTAPAEPAASAGGRVRDGSLSGDQWMDAVAAGVRRIAAGELHKLVLARDVVVELDAPVEPATVLTDLAERYRDCWTYSVEGLVGSTPEMLIKVEDNVARARVLAGTLDRATAPADDPDYAQRVLWGSRKQRQEHEFAINSLLDRLTSYTDTMTVSSEPFVLELPNVWHLASDVTAVLNDAPSPTGKHRTPGALALAEALHPTAAVCGTPTATAAALIGELEHLDRGPYAGPVGWVDATGNGEWGIALRGAVLEGPTTARLFAGCGIVAASDPAAELRETWAKFRPMLQALGVQAH
ncbi:isochorismate synthase [Tersicoccus solisilvae]|uniref:isochorismate synthase n=1 Tax=Tersicoccus solisilvae TaxID=1882339 RepID=A0ABQ1NXF7_9MICC|nr:isochorismate synthase [Tersicoccus solisilvae]GGC86798.1 isochorismate synthase [Tersicoccus solisilvae]